jgi:hypothetical protein
MPETGLKPVHCLATIAALCLSAAAHAAIPAPAPAERLVVADAGKRALVQPAQQQPAKARDEAAPKSRQAAPGKADKAAADFTLHWYN